MNYEYVAWTEQSSIPMLYTWYTSTSRDFGWAQTFRSHSSPEDEFGHVRAAINMSCCTWTSNITRGFIQIVLVLVYLVPGTAVRNKGETTGFASQGSLAKDFVHFQSSRLAHSLARQILVRTAQEVHRADHGAVLSRGHRRAA